MLWLKQTLRTSSGFIGLVQSMTDKWKWLLQEFKHHSELVFNVHHFKESDCKKPWFYRDLLQVEGRVWRRASSSTADLRSPGDMVLPALVKVLLE